ncbi:MAG: sensor histidine kinase [Gemmataceae bacterium]
MAATTAELAVRLPWLAPSVLALTAIAQGASSEDPAILCDPAAIALILRFSKSLKLSPARRARLLRFARRQLARKPVGVVRLDVQAIAQAAKQDASPALRDRAYIIGLLSQIGRLAIAAIDPNAANDNAHDIARCLARRWALPDWCQSALDMLDHPPEVIESLGGNSVMIKSIRSAENVEKPQKLAEISDPYAAPLLRDLLTIAEKSWRAQQSGVTSRLEAEIERMHGAFRDYVAGEAARLQERKLVALAEFSAGAGHEINTPLAIISGQAQLLLSTEENPDRRRSLRTVVQQAHRVHDMLTDLMQFARPAVAQWQFVDLGFLAREVVAVLAPQATAKDVHLETDIGTGIVSCADPRQFRTALQCLVRNAIEAVPTGGHIWVRASVDGAMNSITVEDTGPGVDPAIVEHIFDPFFCGRSAGRGRGLGLSTAWRLARQQGGDVRYLAPAGGPTCFVLSVPKAETNGERLSA